MKKIIYFIPLLLIGCKEAPKEYYSGEVEVIDPVKNTTIVSDSDIIPVNNIIPINMNGVSPEAIEYMHRIEAETPLRHMINPMETAPHIVHLKYN